MRPTSPAARGSPPLAASAESMVTDAERSNRRIICLLHIISYVTCVRHAQGTLPSQSSVGSLLVLLLYKLPCLSCLARPVWGTIDRPLQRRSASDKCSVRCRPIKQGDKIYRNLRSKPTFDKVHFCLFFRNLPQILPSGHFLKK